MAWLIAAIIGGIIGAIYGLGIRDERRLNPFWNLILGAIGGVLGLWLFFVVLGLQTTSVMANFWLGLIWPIVGAVILMTIVEAFRAMSYNAERRRREDRVRDYVEERRDLRRRESPDVAHEYEEEEYRVKKKRK